MKRGYFVSRLAPGTTGAMLRAALRVYGDVLAINIPYHKNGQLRPYAFIQMQHTDKTQGERLLKAQVEVNGKVPRIQLQLAQSHDDPDYLARVKKVHVSGFPDDTDESTLWHLFSQFGKVTEATVVRSKDTGLSRGFGFVKFDKSQSCRSACSTPLQYRGCTITAVPKIATRVRSLRKEVELEVKKARGKPIPSKEELQKERNAKRKASRQKQREWLRSLGGGAGSGTTPPPPEAAPTPATHKEDRKAAKRQREQGPGQSATPEGGEGIVVKKKRKKATPEEEP